MNLAKKKKKMLAIMTISIISTITPVLVGNRDRVSVSMKENADWPQAVFLSLPE